MSKRFVLCGQYNVFCVSVQYYQNLHVANYLNCKILFKKYNFIWIKQMIKGIENDRLNAVKLTMK